MQIFKRIAKESSFWGHFENGTIVFKSKVELTLKIKLQMLLVIKRPEVFLIVVVVPSVIVATFELEWYLSQDLIKGNIAP